MENHKMVQKDGKSLNVPKGWKIKKKFQKDGKMKDIPEGWKIERYSRRMEN